MTGRAGRGAAVTLLAGIVLVGSLTVPASASGAADAVRSTLAVAAWEPLPSGWPTPPPVSASSYLLVDAGSGQVLAERDPDRLTPVASTVKMLAALVVVADADLDEVVEIAPGTGIGGAGVGLRPGERWSVRSLLEASIVRSANDATMALAAHVAGSADAFVVRMRDRAAALGVTDAVIEEVTGLADRNRLSARDLAVIARAFLQEPVLAEIAARPTVSLPGRGAEHTRNLLLDLLPDANGVKTGYTEQAGWSVVGSARRDGRQLVAVVLDARSSDARFDDAARLLEHGFSAFGDAVEVDVDLRLRTAGTWLTYADARASVALPDLGGRIVARLPVDAGADAAVLVTADGQVIARFAQAPAAMPPVRASGVGAKLMDAAYRAMRQGHADALWPTSASDLD